jgi:hypothetical protein
MSTIAAANQAARCRQAIKSTATEMAQAAAEVIGETVIEAVKATREGREERDDITPDHSSGRRERESAHEWREGAKPDETYTPDGVKPDRRGVAKMYSPDDPSPENTRQAEALAKRLLPIFEQLDDSLQKVHAINSVVDHFGNRSRAPRFMQYSASVGKPTLPQRRAQLGQSRVCRSGMSASRFGGSSKPQNSRLAWVDRRTVGEVRKRTTS